MWPFKSKAQKEAERNKQRKIAIVRDLQSISDDASQKRIIKAKVQIEITKDKIDNPNLNLTSIQLDSIEECIRSIKNHMDKAYDELIVGKCKKIDDVLRGKVVATTPEEKAVEDNEDDIIEIESRINGYYDKIDDVIDGIRDLSYEIDQNRDSQSKCLENKAEWKKYFYEIKKLQPKLERKNSELKNLEQQLQIESQTLDMFIKQNQNIATAETIRRASLLTEKIDKQKDIVDTEIVEMYAKHAHEAYENTQKTGNELDKITNKYFQGSGDGLGDDEAEIAWQRAKELDAMNKIDTSNGSNGSGSKYHN